MARETPAAAASPLAGAPQAKRAGPAAVSVPAGAETIRAVQRELHARGYEPGTSDGVPGLITRAAVMAYEWDYGLPLTADPSDGVLQHILLGASQPVRGGGQPAVRSREAESVIRTVQQSLARVGYKLAKTDGRLGDDTIRVIREFEVDEGLPQTGRVSGQLVARLARLAGQGRFVVAP